MQMNDSQRIAAPRAAVWAALNDPEVLRAAIPGCESLEMTAPNEMTAKVTLKVGPVKATFGGKVTLSDIDPPSGYRISGEGSGGVAGFAKGGATVTLAEDGPDATILTYTVDAQIGGKLAQLGARLIDSTARKLAGEFFERFGAIVAGPAEDRAEAPGDAEIPTDVATAAEDVAEPAKQGWLKRMFGGKAAATLALALALPIGAAHLCCIGGAHAASGLDGAAICSRSLAH